MKAKCRRNNESVISVSSTRERLPTAKVELKYQQQRSKLPEDENDRKNNR